MPPKREEVPLGKEAGHNPRYLRAEAKKKIQQLHRAAISESDGASPTRQATDPPG